MLVATNTPSFNLNFDGVASSNGATHHVPPRIISEIRKTSPALPKEQIRPRISGELLVMCGNEKQWWPRRVMVRGGQLLVGSAGSERTIGSLRIPLRHLSLAAGPLPNSLSLYKGANIILTLQTASERSFHLWVKTIAIELIRQTPLDAVKYLDILTITECQTKKQDCVKDCNSNYIKTITPPTLPPPLPIPQSHDEAYHQNIEALLKRCQNSDSYVPVKDKLVLFESLCRLGRKVRSTEDVSVKIVPEDKRATSMYDLSNCVIGPIPGVREICKYFENKQDQIESQYGTITRTRKKLMNSDLQLQNENARIKTIFHNVTCV